MNLEVLPDPASVARRAAAVLAERARAAVAARGRCVLALSGGRTPWAMLRALGREDVPWAHLEVLQVDERVAPRGDPARNLTHLTSCLVAPGWLAPTRLHALDVEAADLDWACEAYAQQLRDLAGTPPVLDLVQLGLGADGHTASLLPGDPVLEVRERDVAATGPYEGHRRLTLTYPALERARGLLWVVTGGDKAPMLRRLMSGDASIPAGRLRHPASLVLADEAAARA